MNDNVKVALVGAGAFGIKHLDGIGNIAGVEVVSLIGRELDKTQQVAAQYGIYRTGASIARRTRSRGRSIPCWASRWT